MAINIEKTKSMFISIKNEIDNRLQEKKQNKWKVFDIWGA